ncbi:hypothetical protein A3L04_07210 [Thermococcus chitonophagus]|uniref:Uncharacterized protein n=2 Tax=Thermococcus chitonophagus TaxID=54262 RepID=A0A2Z2NGN7_9EURY|nr:hypothetical protein [Thermococcus chitonophagus]ASJ16876.1 hypothetical protein A3L04_07210 [Thermococcus chitonophagus]
MKFGQLSIDFLFAITLVTLLSVGIIGIGLQETKNSKALSIASEVKVFAISVRDLITKAYSMGPGYSVKMTLPFSISPGDFVNVSLSGNVLSIYANISGTMYSTSLKIPVGVTSNTSVLLTENSPSFWIIVFYNETEGGVDVKVAKSPNIG